MKIVRNFVFLSAVIAVMPASLAGAASKPPEVNITLLADQSALIPGGTIELAVGFKIETGWHIYWRNRGEGGLEPTFRWKLPTGFTTGPMRFPAPVRHVDRAGVHTFILEGQPTILTELKIPPDLQSGKEVTIGVEVGWLVCKELCYKQDKSLSLKLPVVADAGQVKPVNETEFQIARENLPVPMDRAQYLKRLSATTSVDKVKPGGRFEVAVILEIEANHHINAHEPGSDFLIPTDLFHDAVDGLVIGRPRFDKGHLEPGSLPGEQQSVYRGKTAIILPVEADTTLTGKEVRISGVVTYQACSDVTQQCYRPSAAEWWLILPAAGPGEEVKPASIDLFRALEDKKTSEKGVSTEAAPTSSSPIGDESAGTTSAPDSGGQLSPPGGVSRLGRIQNLLSGLGIVGYLIMAVIGGFILNLMPCVLPVISIKILSFIQQAKESRLRVFTLGLAFAVGIEVSFLVLGGLIVGLGQQWGGLFQRPQVVIGLAAVITAFALSLFGVFVLFPPRVVSELGEKIQREGHLSAFGMGLLATVLGTACTAPFLSAVIAIAVQQPAATGMLIFAVAGLGMAFPYVLLAAQPGWVRIIPRPGPWMKTFEHVVGFCLLATVVWLLSPLAAQIGGDGLLWALLFLLLVSLGVWLYGQVEYGASLRRKLAYYGSVSVLIAGGWWLCFHYAATIPDLVAKQRELRLGPGQNLMAEPDWTGEEFPWIPYTRERAMAAVKSGKTIFVDYTAQWCVNCKANEKLIIDTPVVRRAMERMGIWPFRADYTSYDPEIKADLKRYGRAGVPMYLIIPANRPDEAILLDELLTKTAILENLKKAGASTDRIVSLDGWFLDG